MGPPLRFLYGNISRKPETAFGVNLARTRQKTPVNAPGPAAPASLSPLTAWAGRNSRTVLLISLLANLLLCFLLFDPKPHTGGDNASYVILAQSILRLGDGYTQSIGPGPAVPHTQYPFGYPLLLAPLVALVGPDFALLKLLSMAFSLLAVFLFARIMRQNAAPVTAAAATLCFALNPVLVDYSHWVLTEEAFLCSSLLALYFLTEATRGGGTVRFGRPFWLAVLSLVFTAHIRSIGVAFVGGGLLFFAVRRQWKALAVFFLAVAVLMAPWSIRNHLVSTESSAVAGAFMLKNPYSPELGTIGLSDLATRIGHNIAIYGGAETGRALLGSESLWAVTAPAVWLSVLVSLLVVTGLLGKIVRDGLGMLEAYFAFFLGIVLVWPDAWSDVRFIMPLIPLMLYYLASAVELLVGLVRPWRAQAAVAAAGALIAVAALSLSAQLVRVPANVRMLAAWSSGDRYAGYPPNWRRFFEAADWVRDNTPDSSVVSSRKPRLVYLWSHRTVVGYPFTTDTEAVMAEVTQANYVIVDQVSGTTLRYLVPALQKHQDRFKIVHRTGDPATWVLEVLK